MKHIDYDRFMAEKADDRTDVTIFGETYKIPAELPASLVLRIMRMGADTNITVTDLEEGGRVADIVDTLFGAGTLASWVEKGIGFTTLMKILTDIANGFQDDAAMHTSDGERVPLTS